MDKKQTERTQSEYIDYKRVDTTLGGTMNTYDQSYSHPKSKSMRTVTFTIPWEIHLEICKIVSKEGKSVTRVLRDLLTEGVYGHLERSEKSLEKSDLLFFGDLNKVRQRKHRISLLAELRGNLPDDKYTAYCRRYGIDPSEVDNMVPQCGNRKQDRVRGFLQVLFVDRPNGLESNRILEIAKQEGFGENMTRQEARKLNIEQKWKKINGSRVSVWIPPEDW